MLACLTLNVFFFLQQQPQVHLRTLIMAVRIWLACFSAPSVCMHLWNKDITLVLSAAPVLSFLLWRVNITVETRFSHVIWLITIIKRVINSTSRAQIIDTRMSDLVREKRTTRTITLHDWWKKYSLTKKPQDLPFFQLDYSQGVFICVDYLNASYTTAKDYRLSPET